MKSQRKALFFDLKDPILIIGFLATLKFANDSNNINEGTAMWAFLEYVMKALANVLISHLFAEDRLSPIVTSVHTE